MTNTSQYPVTIDGVRLDTLAYNISTKMGRDLAASSASANIDTEMRHGELWVPHKKYGPGRLVLDMWVGGTDEDGAVPVGGDDYKKYRENLDDLRRMFGVRGRLLDIRIQLDKLGTSIRQCFGEVTNVIDPEMLASYPYTAQMKVEVNVPGAFWQDVADSNFDSGSAVAANSDHPLPAFAAGTAPMVDLYTVLDGPATNPKLIDSRNGHYDQYNGIVPLGQQWVVNTTLHTSKVGVGIAFTQGGTDVYAQTVFAGGHAPALFGISADPAGPQIRLEGSGFGAATRLRVRGKIKYL